MDLLVRFQMFTQAKCAVASWLGADVLLLLFGFRRASFLWLWRVLLCVQSSSILCLKSHKTLRLLADKRAVGMVIISMLEEPFDCEAGMQTVSLATKEPIHFAVVGTMCLELMRKPESLIAANFTVLVLKIPRMRQVVGDKSS